MAKKNSVDSRLFDDANEVELPPAAVAPAATPKKPGLKRRPVASDKMADKANNKALLRQSKASSELVTAAEMYDRVKQKAERTGKLREMSNANDGGDTYYLGLKIPFAMQFLLGSEVLRLGIAVELNGPPMSCKTMLMYEFGRIFTEADGWLDMIITEGKSSPGLVRSVVGWCAKARRGVKAVMVSTMNAMMTQLVFRLQIYKHMATKGGEGVKASGYKFPVLLGVDSLMGANASETSNKIATEGDVRRSFPVEALILTPFLKEVANRIASYPYVLMLINHRKEGEKDETKPYEKVKFTKPGGKQPRFQATYELVTHLVKGWQEIDRRADGGAEVEHRLIKISNGKNSAGTDGREVKVRVSWRNVIVEKKRADGKIKKVSRQLTKWHWDEALAPMLSAWKNGKQRRSVSGVSPETVARTAKLDAILHLREVTGGRFWSKTLGISKDTPATAERIGRLIEANDDILDGLRALFGIEDGYVWDTSKDFLRELRRLRKFAETEGADFLDGNVASLDNVWSDDDDEAASGAAEEAANRVQSIFDAVDNGSLDVSDEASALLDELLEIGDDD
jgi:hypothetical protein